MPPRFAGQRGETLPAATEHTDLEALASRIRRSVVGDGARLVTPFGERRLAYTDWAASGRALAPVEDFLRAHVLPLYGNTHTSASACGRQSSSYLDEARTAVGVACNARRQYSDAHSDCVLFTGSGATSAATALVRLLGLAAPLAPGVPSVEGPLVLVGPYEHHSNLLPWRESCATVQQLPPDPRGRGVCLLALRAALAAAGRRLVVGAFCAASNVTGCCEDVDAVTSMLHAHGALAVWDFAAAGCGGPSLDVNPASSQHPDCAKDAVFLSPHKLPGGPGACGVLVVKRRLLGGAVPQRPGGGTVFFVTADSHRYLSAREEREEGGTPDLLGALRAAAALRLKAACDCAPDPCARTMLPAPLGCRAAPVSGPGAAGSALAARLHASLAACPALSLLGPPCAPGEHRLPTLAFLIRTPPGCGAPQGRWLHPGFVSALLNDLFGLQTRAGCDCAGPYGLALLGISHEYSAALEAELAAKSGWGEAVRPGWTRLSFPWHASAALEAYALAAVHAVAAHGWRLLPLYRLDCGSGEWAHASKGTRFPDRRWLAELGWPETLTVPAVPAAADGAAAAAGAALDTPEAEAALESAWAAHLGAAGGIFASAAAGAEKHSPSDVVPATEADTLRWFALPSEAAALLRASPPADAAALAAGTLVPPSPLPATPMLADTYSSLAGPPGPIAPLTYLPDGTIHTPPQTASLQTHPARSAALAPVEAAALARGFRKHPQRSTADSPGHIDLAALARLRHGGPGADAAEAETEGADAAEEAPDGPSTPPSSEAAEPPLAIEATIPAAQPAAGWRRVAPPRPLMRTVSRAIAEHDMIRAGDRLLLGLSGGKDSLALLHILLELQRRAPIRFEVAAATVDPGTASFDPRPLSAYCVALGVTHHLLSNRIFDNAGSGSLEGDSICAFCARMKRGALYSCARAHGYSSLVLGQHCDDLAESLLLSLFHNGQLRTMQAAYTNGAGDVRIVRPLIHVREAALKAFSYGAGLPVIVDNCPACFSAPQQRARVKKLLRTEEGLFPRLFANLDGAMAPLTDARVGPLLKAVGAELSGRGFANRGPERAAAAERAAAEAAAGVSADEAAVRGLSDVALLQELRRRGGLGVGAGGAAAAAAAEAEEEAEADGGGACAWQHRGE